MGRVHLVSTQNKQVLKMLFVLLFGKSNHQWEATSLAEESIRIGC